MRSSASSVSRPTVGPSGFGRLPGVPWDRIGGKRRGQVGGPRLEDPDPLGHVLEAVLAEVEELQVRVGAEQAGGGLGHEHLTGVRRPGQPTRLLDVEPDVAVLVPLRRARVHAHPHAHLRVVGNRDGAQRPLRIEGRSDRVVGGGEDDRERRRLGLELAAAVRSPRAATDLPLLLEDLQPRRTEIADLLGRSLRFGHHEGDRAGGQRRERGRAPPGVQVAHVARLGQAAHRPQDRVGVVEERAVERVERRGQVVDRQVAGPHLDDLLLLDAAAGLGVDPVRPDGRGGPDDDDGDRGIDLGGQRVLEALTREQHVVPVDGVAGGDELGVETTGELAVGRGVAQEHVRHQAPLARHTDDERSVELPEARARPRGCRSSRAGLTPPHALTCVDASAPLPG